MSAISILCCSLRSGPLYTTPFDALRHGEEVFQHRLRQSCEISHVLRGRFVKLVRALISEQPNLVRPVLHGRGQIVSRGERVYSGVEVALYLFVEGFQSNVEGLSVGHRSRVIMASTRGIHSLDEYSRDRDWNKLWRCASVLWRKELSNSDGAVDEQVRTRSLIYLPKRVSMWAYILKNSTARHFTSWIGTLQEYCKKAPGDCSRAYDLKGSFVQIAVRALVRQESHV